MKSALVALMLFLFTSHPVCHCLSKNTDALCNNGSSFACVCYRKDGLLNSYKDCRNLIGESSLGVVELEVVEDFNPLDRFTTTGTDIEPYFKKQLAWLVSSYCERLVNNCKGIGLAINQESVVLLELSSSPTNRTIINFVITKSRFDNGDLKNSTTMDPSLIAKILTLRVRKLEETTGIWHVFDIRPDVLIAVETTEAPRPQNYGMVVALIIVAIGLGICYLIASIKVIKDHIARKRAERLREAQSSQREASKSYGTMDNAKPDNSAAPMPPRPIDIHVVEAPSNGEVQHHALPGKASPGSRCSSIIEVDVGYQTPEPEPQPDVPLTRRAPPPVPQRRSPPKMEEESRKSSHSSSSSRRRSSSSSKKSAASSTIEKQPSEKVQAETPTPPSPPASPSSQEPPGELHQTYLVLPHELDAAVRRAVSTQDVNMNEQSVGEHDSNFNTLFPAPVAPAAPAEASNEIGRSHTISEFPNTQPPNPDTNFEESSSSGSDTEVDDENELTVPGDYEVLHGSSDNLLENVESEPLPPMIDEPATAAINSAFEDTESAVPETAIKPPIIVKAPSIEKDEASSSDTKLKRNRTVEEVSSSGSDSSASSGGTVDDGEQQLTTSEYARLAESSTSIHKLNDKHVHDSISEYDLRDMNSMANIGQSRDTSQEWNGSHSNSDIDLK